MRNNFFIRLICIVSLMLIYSCMSGVRSSDIKNEDSLSTGGFASSCVGTEPFWNAKIDDKAISFEDSGQGFKQKIALSRSAPAVGNLEDYVRVFFDARGVSGVSTRGACSDGMSENIYQHSIVLFTENGTYRGCCN